MGNIGFRKAKCKDCFKCVRICPVKAVRRRNERAQFMARECIQCGLCLESCPQHAISVFSDIDKIKEYFAKGEKVVVTISPAYLGIIDDAEKFRAYMGQKGVDHFIADGSHEIPYGASYDDIINILTQK